MSVFRFGADRLENRPMRIAIDRSPAQPLPADASNLLSTGLASLLYEGLFRVDRRGRVVPGLSREATSSLDGRTWTFDLRESRWSDGVAVRAQDFVFALMSAARGDHVRAAAHVLAELDWSAQDDGEPPICALSENLLQIRWQDPCFDAPRRLAQSGFLPWRPASGDGRYPTNGPYALGDQLPGGRILLTPNRFWRGAAATREIECIPMDARAAFAAARAHQIDWAGSPWGARLQMILQPPERSWQTGEAIGLVWLRINTKRSPLRDAALRRSIAAALAPPLWQAAPPRCWPLPVGGDQRRLSAPAGLKAPLPEGRVLELLVLADPEREQQGALVQSVLLQHGVTVEITPLESKTLCGRISRGEYDFCLTSWMADSVGPEEMLLPWCDASKAGNATGWGSAEVANCILASRQTGSAAPLLVAARIVEAAAPVVPLAGLEWRYWAGPQMAHWAVTPIGSYDWISAGFLPSEEDHGVDRLVPGVQGDPVKLIAGPPKSD